MNKAPLYLLLFLVCAGLFACTTARQPETLPQPPGQKLILDDNMYLCYNRVVQDIFQNDDLESASAPYLLNVSIYRDDELIQELNNLSYAILDGNDQDLIDTDDYNLDGQPDFSFVASFGNVMVMRDVYLFDAQKGQFVYSESFSDLPCLDVDRDNNLVVGGCFHSSACENWTEEYRVNGFDQLELVRSFGTECGPAGSDYYLTFDRRYANGQLSQDDTQRVPLDAAD